MCHVLEVTNQPLRLRHTLVQQLWLPRQWPLFASICIVTVPAIEAPGNFHLIWPSIQWTFSLEVKEFREFLHNQIPCFSNLEISVFLSKMMIENYWTSYVSCNKICTQNKQFSILVALKVCHFNSYFYVRSQCHINFTLHFWPVPIWSWDLKCVSGWKNLLWLWPAFSHELYYYMKVEFLLE